MFQSDGTFVRHMGSFGTGPGQFLDPFDLFVDPSGGVYVMDDSNQQLTKFDPAGAFAWSIGGEDETDPDLIGPKHHGAVDSAGRLWFAQDEPPRIVVITRTARSSTPSEHVGTVPASSGSGRVRSCSMRPTTRTPSTAPIGA